MEAIYNEYSHKGLRVPKARLIAFYLPQFHPIPENDVWWEPGFTEWTNVAKARPLFKGHYQPRIPADLGFYDLRVPEVREAQAALARSAGIEGFCYWHYWFGGRRILERPFEEVLKSGQPDFPFCLGWANQTWTGIWHGAPNRILIQQTYPGLPDYEKHFYAVLQAFHDARYIRFENKPVFVVYRPTELPCPSEFIDLWQGLAQQNGLPGIHFVAHVFSDDQPYDFRSRGFDGAIAVDSFKVSKTNVWQRSRRRYSAKSAMPFPLAFPSIVARGVAIKGKEHMSSFLRMPTVFDYSEAMLFFLDSVTSDHSFYPCIVPNWDNSPRSGIRSTVFHNATPELFRLHVRRTIELVSGLAFEKRIVFIKSWNEWAEGNYLEPDRRYGHQFLEVLAQELLTTDAKRPNREYTGNRMDSESLDYRTASGNVE